ncbi:MAG: hypothetical protein M1825_000218 [Sarcosagium campestre]|nr:MAG: hypothetical protein M1825_000218 [Sarcosagium campestre]
MFSPFQYSGPPGAYVPYEFADSTPTTPEGYLSPSRYSTNASSPLPRSSKRHSRRASHDASGLGHHSGRTSSRQRSSPDADPGARSYSTSQRKAEYVSRPERSRSKSSRFWVPVSGGYGRRASNSQTHDFRAFDSSEEDLQHDYLPYSPLYRGPSYRQADEYVVYDEQVPVYAEAEATVRRSRARRSSHSHSTPAKSSPKTPSKPPMAKPTPIATEEDRVRAGIPAGYSLKNWDPTEEPVTLLGSVFDANSLGKWIYDWTVYHHGAATPMTEIAGEMWLLLIQLSGKVKRAEECMPRIRKEENRDMVEDFLESGERLWERVRRLLKSCEQFMWKAARREHKDKGVSMGKASGCEFVDSIFGRDRELEKTEKLMQGMRLWSMRFDVNCEDILRRPSS